VAFDKGETGEIP